MEDILEKVRRQVIYAMASDDELLNLLVLKGGNALDLVYNISNRGSVDLDYSMESDITDISEIEERIKYALEDSFKEIDYHAFDIAMKERPRNLPENVQDFWGGYKVYFKLIPIAKYRELKKDVSKLRNEALPIGDGQLKTFEIDISKHEYCERREHRLDGLKIYVYPIELILFEKLRAICQQLPEYNQAAGVGNPRPRPRDFYDVYNILENFSIDLSAKENLVMLTKVFTAKKVPLDFLQKIRDSRDMHRAGFESLQDSIKAKSRKELKDFDFYFEYVQEKILPIVDALKAL